ncbi:MAG: hypothetical protein HXL53_02370 [Solobacterium sp.]|nr:hypothetical protein [Solobacterium sp.]
MNKKNKKKVVNTAALGLSLLMSSTLLVGSAVSVYASPIISTTEQNAIDAFLATQPVDGDTRNIGTTNPALATPITYTFPGTNYVSMFCDRNRTINLTQDDVYTVNSLGYGTTINAKIKDFNTIVWYKIINTPEYLANTGGVENDWYFAKKITVINQADNSEVEIDHPVLSLGSRVLNPIPFGRYFIDVPIEAEDPRFHIEYTSEDQATRFNYHGGYWKFVVPMSEEYSYDTIVQADESLKTNETVIDEGAFGTKAVDVIGQFTNISTLLNPTQVYNSANADVIYNNIVADFNNATAANPEISHDFDWGGYSADVVFTAPRNRIIRVGIDYTHYIAEDGTVLLPTVYGLQGAETISGYQLSETRTEANGDRVYVYKTITAASASTPKTADTTNIFGFAVMFMMTIFAGAKAFIARSKDA